MLQDRHNRQCGDRQYRSVELFCDPEANRSIVAVLEGETLPICAKLSMGLKVRKEKTLIAD